MKFIAAVLALATVAFAYPTVNMNGELRVRRGGGKNLQADTLTDSYLAPVKRQNIVTADVSAPAMTDASGNVVPFDATRVDQARRKL